MIQLGSKVRVAPLGRFKFRGEVVEMAQRLAGPMVKVRVTDAAASGELDRWVMELECVEEEPIMPAPPDALFPRPTLADATALRILSDWLEERGNDPGAALLRDVASRIERDVEACEAFGKIMHSHNELARSVLADFGAMPPAGDFPS